jgi:hypothetical protein
VTGRIAQAIPPRWDFEELGTQTCQHCRHFADDPAVIEAEIPGLTSFGSAYSSARGHAGICRTFDRFLDPMYAWECPLFEARVDCGTPPPGEAPTPQFESRFVRGQRHDR